jgi:hypothetical protein
MSSKLTAESEMLVPILGLYPKSGYIWLQEVPLGRKKIDLVCIPRHEPRVELVAIELKISDWRKALWQACVNLQVAHRSYIAIWHEFAHRPSRHKELIDSYGVGLMVVHPGDARIVMPSRGPVHRIARERKGAWYSRLLTLQDEIESCQNFATT